MRLVCAVLSMSLFCVPASAWASTVTLAWNDAAQVGTEAVLLVRSEDGATSVSLRNPVAANSTTTQIDLPPLARTAQTLQAGLIADGAVILQSAIVSIVDRTAPQSHLMLHQNLAVGFNDAWECDDGRITQVFQHGDRLEIRYGATSLSLQAQSDVARHYVSEDGSAITFAGNQAELTLPGQAPLVCQPTLFRPVLPLEAIAANGDWRIELGQDAALIDLPGLEDESLSSAGLAIMAPRNGIIEISAPSVSLRLTQERCRLQDNALIFPVLAELTIYASGQISGGCAGSVMELLSGRDWYVTSIFGLPLSNSAKDSRDMTLQIGDGQISGRGTCNRYVGRALIADGRLSFRELGTTRLACPANLRNLELRFLDALEATSGFDLSRDGMLILQAAQMPILTAVRR